MVGIQPGRQRQAASGLGSAAGGDAGTAERLGRMASGRYYWMEIRCPAAGCRWWRMTIRTRYGFNGTNLSFFAVQ